MDLKPLIRYTFKNIEKCNMCGSSVSTHSILGKRMNRSQGKNPRNKIGITTTVMKCSVCGLIYSNPMPIPDCIQDHYEVPPEEYWNENYFKLDATYFKKEIRTLKNLYDFKAGHKALDIGAGIGKCMTALMNAGFDVFGFEPSQSFRTRAIDKMNIRPDRLMLASIENADFPDDFFDFITFGAVLEHLYDPAASINQAMNWLRPGGIMHIEVPSSEWLISRLVNAYYRAQGLDYVTNISPMHEPFHLYEFSLTSFEHNAIRNQYEIVYSEYYVCDTFMPNVLAKLFGQYMKWTKKGMQLCVWLRKK